MDFYTPNVLWVELEFYTTKVLWVELDFHTPKVLWVELDFYTPKVLTPKQGNSLFDLYWVISNEIVSQVIKSGVGEILLGILTLIFKDFENIAT